MSEHKDFDSIMKGITSGLTGEPEKDIPYIQKICEEYKDHEYSKEILRACGRLMYDMIPDDKKEELNKAAGKDTLGTEATIEEIRFNIYKKDYEKAFHIAEGLVRKVEDANLFQDDQVSEYHQFNEFLEEMLYKYLYKPSKEIRRAELIRYTEIYSLYGSLLVELKKIEEAREALKKGLRWNPVDFSITSEYIETFKMEGDMETFFQKTMEAFKIAIHAPQIARCYRNLGYYFTEKKLYPVAVSVYQLSMLYEKDSKNVQAELYYINQVSGGIDDPSIDDIKAYAEKYGFPMGANEHVLGLAYECGKHFAETGETEGARYCFSVLYELTHDEDIKKIIDSIPSQE